MPWHNKGCYRNHENLIIQLFLNTPVIRPSFQKGVALGGIDSHDCSKRGVNSDVDF